MPTDPNETVKSVADATKSLSDTAHAGIDLTDKAFVWLARMLGEEAAGLLKDRIFFWRAQNALVLQEKLDRILEKRHLVNPKAIPLRLAIPFLESATLEDDEILQEQWARLLANAMDPSCTAGMERYHGNILANLSPVDCLLINLIRDNLLDGQVKEVTPELLAEQTTKDEQQILIALGNLCRHGLVERRPRLRTAIASFKAWTFQYGAFYLTELGTAFLLACSDGTEHSPHEKRDK